MSLICLSQGGGAGVPTQAKYGFFLLGTRAGEYTFSKSAEGVLRSEFSGPKPPLSGSSVVVAKRATDGTWEVSFDQTLAGQKVKFEGKGGKLVGEAAGRKIDAPWTHKEPLFGNLHAGFNSQPILALEGKDQGKVKVLIADGGGVADVAIRKTGDRSVQVEGKARLVRSYELDFTTVKVTVVLNEANEVVAEDVPTQGIKIVRDGWDGVLVDPLTLYPELSQPTHQPETVAKESVALRDGIKLYHTRVSPKTPGKYPTILVRTPYGRESQALMGETYAKRGYVFMVQDCRGREESEGEFDPFAHEGRDGKDTIDWIAQQPWSDGKVGMIGGSYSGAVQWQAAVEHPKALKCIIPQVSPPGPNGNIPYEFGTFSLYPNVWWSRVVANRKTDLGSAGTAVPNSNGFLTLPLSKVDDAVLGKNIPFFDEWVDRRSAKAFGDWNFDGALGKVKIPALHISGWWDGDGIGTRLNWQATRKNGVEDQWLIYGPWTHAFNTTSKLGDVDYGADAILELESLYLRWFDRWLKGKDVGIGKVPRARIFITGANRWAEWTDFPAPAAKQTTWYFGGDGPSNGLTSMGTLVEKATNADPDRYTYNPASVKIPEGLKNPDPAKATTKLELKPEEEYFLLYKGPSFEKPTVVTGPVDIRVSFSTSAKDADLFGFLVDQSPDGVFRLIGQPGKVRLSGIEAKPISAGRIYTVNLAHWDIAHQFAKGHRLVVMLASDYFPMFARNLGTGEPAATATRMVSAHQTVYRDAKHPSWIRFFALPGN